mgnify:CR=1 FL=1
MSLTTKRALANSLKKLLSKRSFDKITVKDIVEDCGVNRQTFYYHFHDIYDLIEWIFQDAAEDLIRNGLDYEDWSAGLEILLQYLQENRALILNAYNSISHEVVADYIKKVLRPYAENIVHKQAELMGSSVADEDVELVTDIFTLASSGLVMEWIGGQMLPNDTMIRMDKFRKAISGSIQFMLHNLSGDAHPNDGTEGKEQ